MISWFYYITEGTKWSTIFLKKIKNKKQKTVKPLFPVPGG
ncbi:hypothetical protein GTCCBUS3UF5_5330 [Geobacillus thermoleovorans CCB_US3_UF5]|uniref:Uncharacterized protein n=2 Tax=Geobacillus thermoleovorans group TaxID=1505648 RepID=U2X727_GEOKU|nr:hypothetical protein GTCCBUS3UF5_5330 [Geobacillus thermoleovorans CCB_US3_UF5]GAD14740.1 hypothetical protein GBL_2957 [Geobacillus kaustophilus GBlys]GAJ60492.1 hypothetical protein B23_3737 [Geobacillus thermoleovorans B23]